MTPELQFALEMADAADTVTMTRFRALDLAVETKPDRTPVTEADRAAEVMLRKMIAERFPSDMPANAADELMTLARAELAHLTDNPRIAAFWLPRLERFAEWFAETDPTRRAGIVQALTEAGFLGALIPENAIICDESVKIGRAHV